MQINKINDNYSSTGQIDTEDLNQIHESGFKTIMCFRPTSEDKENQPDQSLLKMEAHKKGIKFISIPITPGNITEENIQTFTQNFNDSDYPVLGYCRSGGRAKSIYQAYEKHNVSQTAQDVTGACNWTDAFDVVVIGGGASGVAITASLLKRRKALRIAVIDPKDEHYYQPAWTLVGGGTYDAKKTVRSLKKILHKKATLIKGAVQSFDPDTNSLVLDNGDKVNYHQLIICPGLRLAWEKIEGLQDTLGKNNVSSNYDFHHAQYTWECIQKLDSGKALFTQPPMPIKCAGAPQKAMYLSANYWERKKTLDNIDVQFFNAGPVLFGVADFVPPLMEYVKRYNAELNFNHKLTKIDGPNQTAWFEYKDDQDNIKIKKVKFDFIHVVPPQEAPEFIKNSKLSDDAGWLDVDQLTLQHKRYPNIFGLGDVINSPNAKTAAAARKQVYVVAENLIAAKELRNLDVKYDGYGACPLTVEKGKVVLAEFGFGGKLLPTFPLHPPVARRSSWFMKQLLMPWLYWNLMQKGIEWLAKPSRK
jgi:sulfide:quinone oxidoreductase